MKSRRGRISLATLSAGLAIALILGLGTLSASAQQGSSRVLAVYHKTKNFRIPFNVVPADRQKLKEIQLWSSDDSGFSWKLVSRTTPERRVFNFRAPRDGEYWFAVRTLDKQGMLVPSEEMKVEPSMKVTVDTVKPTIVLEPDGRRGSQVAVRWEVKDDHLDLKSLTLDYQLGGARDDWRQVPIRKQSLIGSETWDAGTAEILKVRATVSDRAGNVAEEIIDLPDGTPANPTLTSNSLAFNSTPPVSQVSDAGSSFPPSDEPSTATPSLGETDANLTNGGQSAFDASGLPTPPPQPQYQPAPSRVMTPAVVVNPNQPPASAPSGTDPDPFGGPAVEGNGGAAPVPLATGAGQTLLVNNPNCAIQYAVEDAGPAGPAVVELWVTPDGGRNWIRKGEDPDRTSPFQVDLGGDGTFGLRLVARGASGLGDLPPAPGDVPHFWVEVDRTPPTVQMLPPVVGSGVNLGKVAIRWRASDLHIATKAVSLFWRPDQSGAAWQPITEQPIDNTGKFLWIVPTSIPPKFHVKVTAVDTVGNIGSVETNEGEAVILDRTRPKSRITGLAPTAQTSNNAIR